MISNTLQILLKSYYKINIISYHFSKENELQTKIYNNKFIYGHKLCLLYTTKLPFKL